MTCKLERLSESVYMNFLIKRELITNIALVADIEGVSWGKYKVAIRWDPTDSLELHISGSGSWQDIAFNTEKEEELLQIIDRLSVHRQSHVSLGRNMAVFQNGTGPTRRFTSWIHKQRLHQGLWVQQSQQDALNKWLETKPEDQISTALRWIRRSINSINTYESFIFLILAAEALTTDIFSYPKCRHGELINHCNNGHPVDQSPRTNHDELEAIMGKDLHRKLYRENVRNQLFHGRYIKESSLPELLRKLYPRLIKRISDAAGMPLRELEDPMKQYGYEEGMVKMLFNTGFQSEDIPHDAPSIAELKQWWDRNEGVIKEPLPPKNIRHAEK